MTQEIMQLNEFQLSLVELAEKLGKECEKKKEAQEEKLLSCAESQQIDLDKMDWDRLKLLWGRRRRQLRLKDPQHQLQHLVIFWAM
jgi:hypothetical protein